MSKIEDLTLTRNIQDPETLWADFERTGSVEAFLKFSARVSVLAEVDTDELPS
jgi:hypothetical protein